ncbi:MAG: hypothetical protein ACXWWR_03155 [Candidatus Limnocylindrales bacterium]
MRQLRLTGRLGLFGGLVSLALGVLLAVGSALIAGDWWLAREPWMGFGLTLLVIGLAATAVFGLLLDAVEPLGWLRLLALPPAIVVAFLWSIWLVFGVPTTGPGPGPERDIRTILYSLPEMLVVVSIATLLIPLPLGLAHLRGRKPDGQGYAVGDCH